MSRTFLVATKCLVFVEICLSGVSSQGHNGFSEWNF